MSIQQEPFVDAHRAVADPVATRRIVDQPVVAEPVRSETIATTTGRRYAFDSFIVGVVGLALLIIGLVAIARGGFNGPMDEPVFSVMGFTHTTTLGLIEAAVGLFLVLAALSTSRSAAILFGLVLVAGGVVGAVQTDSFRRSLGLESSFAWVAVGLGAFVVLVSLMVPRRTTQVARVESV